jgi:hypothetical protein
MAAKFPYRAKQIPVNRRFFTRIRSQILSEGVDGRSEGISGNHGHRTFMQRHSPSLQCQLRYSYLQTYLKGRLDVARVLSAHADQPTNPAGRRPCPGSSFAAILPLVSI